MNAKLKELKDELEYQLDLKYFAAGDKLLQCTQKIKILRKQIKELEKNERI